MKPDQYIETVMHDLDSRYVGEYEPARPLFDASFLHRTLIWEFTTADQGPGWPRRSGMRTIASSPRPLHHTRRLSELYQQALVDPQQGFDIPAR